MTTHQFRSAAVPAPASSSRATRRAVARSQGHSPPSHGIGSLLLPPNTATSIPRPNAKQTPPFPLQRIESQHTGEVVLLVSHGDTLSITQAAVLSPQDLGHHNRRYAFNTAELRPLLQAPADGAPAGGH